MKILAAKWALFLAATVAASMLLENGCSGPQQRTTEANGAYGVMLADCIRQAVPHASSPAEAHDAGMACFDSVDVAWGLKDGGSR